LTLSDRCANFLLISNLSGMVATARQAGGSNGEDELSRGDPPRRVDAARRGGLGASRIASSVEERGGG